MLFIGYSNHLYASALPYELFYCHIYWSWGAAAPQTPRNHQKHTIFWAFWPEICKNPYVSAHSWGAAAPQTPRFRRLARRLKVLRAPCKAP